MTKLKTTEKTNNLEFVNLELSVSLLGCNGFPDSILVWRNTFQLGTQYKSMWQHLHHSSLCHLTNGKSVNDDYKAWLNDDFIPTKRQLKIMCDMGYPMLENTRTRGRNQKRK